MRENSYLIILAFACVVVSRSAQADTFGSGANTFTVDFRNIGNAGNAADTTGYGAVAYTYRIGTFEISQDVIIKSTGAGLSNVTAGAWTGNQPAANISWYEAAAFVNWLNTSTGKQAAYNLSFNGSWSMSLWSNSVAWTLGGTNLFRHKDAFYFLPSEDEWYKAAYYNSTASNYFLYPTAGNTPPTTVTNGTNANTAVYNVNAPVGTFGAPAAINSAGGTSPYGTTAQGGNVMEWVESALDGSNDVATDSRTTRGGDYNSLATALQSSFRDTANPTAQFDYLGFRVASVPEPSTYALLLLAGAGLALMARRKTKRK